MELLQHLLPNQTDLALTSWNLDAASSQIILELSSTHQMAECPLCHCSSHRVHSHYERTVKDLPLAQFTLVILLGVCKFFCLNDDCCRRIFSERLPAMVAPWARRTVRYTEKLKTMGLALGGAAAARLSHQLGYGYSRDSILRLITKLSLPEIAPPRILGVDDFALRKGHVYGTILVDLETHRPIALLPDRTAKTLETWLKAHPGVEIMSRDRSKTYRKGMNDGAPDAIQVADRFHLLKNLEETLEKVFKSESHVLKEVEQTWFKANGTTPSLPLTPLAERTEQPDQKRTQRLENYKQAHALRAAGHTIGDIAHHLAMGERTVHTYLSYSAFPEWQPTVRLYRSSSQLDDYKPYLKEQWQQGRQLSKELFEEIQQQGYQGSYMTVTRYTRQLRQRQRESLNDLPGRGPAPKPTATDQKPLSAQRAAWLIMRRAESLSIEEKEILERLCQHPVLSASIVLTQSFLNLVRQRLPEQLDDWLTAAKGSSIKAFQGFSKGLKEDYDAVKAGVTLEISNGQVEGQNNRLKMLKRQMFGRAGLDLLAKRFILKG
jgi:transposase